MAKPTDVIVIGGGISGICTAFGLAKRGVDVTLIEKMFIAGGPTGRSSAVVRQHYSNEVTASMALESLKVFQNFDDVVGGDCGFHQTGMILGVRESDLEMLKANVGLQQEVGINTRVIDIKEIRELEPYISTDGLAAAAYEPESGYADPAGTCNSYAQAAKRHGCKLIIGDKAISIIVEKGKVTGLETDKGKLPAENVVVAAGPWSPQLVNPTGIELPMEACRHQVCFYKWPAKFKHNAVYADFVESVYMRPESGDLMLVGSIDPNEAEDKVSDPDDFNEGVGLETITHYSERVAHRFPEMIEGGYTTGYSALYDITPDWHSIMDELPSAKGLYCMAGSSGHGFKLGPAVGEMMAKLIVDGKKPEDDINLFSFDRFEKNQFVRGKYEYNILG